ncbi:MAG: hypothetical protein LBQ62_06015 [Candidatus Accumulibacter sp.]|nr:hypothetical protein [Accumulibacter sp.]
MANKNNWQRSRAALEALGINVEPYGNAEQAGQSRQAGFSACSVFPYSNYKKSCE